MFWLVWIIFLLQRSAESSLSSTCVSTYNGIWLNNTNSCFILFQSSTGQDFDWNQAQKQCINGNSNSSNNQLARLANIYDKATWSVLAPWLANSSTNGIWFGLYRVSNSITAGSSTDWKWINYQDGFQTSLNASSLSSMNVKMNFNLQTSNCVAIMNQTLWKPTSCNQPLPYLCELYYVSSITYQQCPYGWAQIGQQCYMPLRSIPTSWMASQIACSAIGGNLPTFQSSADWNKFQTYRSTLLLKNDQIWIGANESYNANNVYNYIDGSIFVTSFWSKNQTNSFFSQCVVSAWNNNPPYMWSNVPCFSDNFAICQLQCRSPFKLSYGLCVLGTGNTTDFYRGVQECQTYQASLPIFHNSFQWESFFLFISIQNFSSDFWLGLVQTYSQLQWTNIDFSNQNYYNWASGYPTTIDNCAVANITSRSMINDNCMKNYNLICVYYPAVSWTTCPITSDTYSLNWQKTSYGSNTVCYRYLPEESPTDYVTALKKCSAIRGKLPSMYNGIEEYWDLTRYAGVLNSTLNLVPNNVWLGTTQQMELGVWQNMEGSLTNFSPPWFVGTSANQINNFAFANMLQNSTWSTDLSNGHHHVICEYRSNFNPSIDNTACLSNLTSPTYYDTKNTDVNGTNCLPWISSSNDTAYLPDNYCRDPFLNSTMGPWCYTLLGIQAQCFYDPCLSMPCLNNGTCINNCNNYTCNCIPPFYGINCQIAPTSSSATSSTTSMTSLLAISNTLPSSSTSNFLSSLSSSVSSILNGTFMYTASSSLSLSSTSTLQSTSSEISISTSPNTSELTAYTSILASLSTSSTPLASSTTSFITSLRSLQSSSIVTSLMSPTSNTITPSTAYITSVSTQSTTPGPTIDVSSISLSSQSTISAISSAISTEVSPSTTSSTSPTTLSSQSATSTISSAMSTEISPSTTSSTSPTTLSSQSATSTISSAMSTEISPSTTSSTSPATTLSSPPTTSTISSAMSTEISPSTTSSTSPTTLSSPSTTSTISSAMPTEVSPSTTSSTSPATTLSSTSTTSTISSAMSTEVSPSATSSTSPATTLSSQSTTSTISSAMSTEIYPSTTSSTSPATTLSSTSPATTLSSLSTTSTISSAMSTEIFPSTTSSTSPATTLSSQSATSTISSAMPTEVSPSTTSSKSPATTLSSTSPATTLPSTSPATTLSSQSATSIISSAMPIEVSPSTTSSTSPATTLPSTSPATTLSSQSTTSTISSAMPTEVSPSTTSSTSLTATLNDTASITLSSSFDNSSSKLSHLTSLVSSEAFVFTSSSTSLVTTTSPTILSSTTSLTSSSTANLSLITSSTLSSQLSWSTNNETPQPSEYYTPSPFQFSSSDTILESSKNSQTLPEVNMSTLIPLETSNNPAVVFTTVEKKLTIPIQITTQSTAESVFDTSKSESTKLFNSVILSSPGQSGPATFSIAINVDTADLLTSDSNLSAITDTTYVITTVAPPLETMTSISSRITMIPDVTTSSHGTWTSVPSKTTTLRETSKMFMETATTSSNMTSIHSDSMLKTTTDQITKSPTAASTEETTYRRNTLSRNKSSTTLVPAITDAWLSSTEIIQTPTVISRAVSKSANYITSILRSSSNPISGTIDHSFSNAMISSKSPVERLFVSTSPTNTEPIDRIYTMESKTSPPTHKSEAFQSRSTTNRNVAYEITSDKPISLASISLNITTIFPSGLMTSSLNELTNPPVTSKIPSSESKSYLKSTTASANETKVSRNISFPNSQTATMLSSTSSFFDLNQLNTTVTVQQGTKITNVFIHSDENGQNNMKLNFSKSSTSTEKPYHYIMTDLEFVASAVIQTLGCIYILSCIGLTLLLFIAFRSFTVERIIVVNQDIALFIAHCFIMTLREPKMYGEMNMILCKFVAIGLQYFYNAAYMFMLLESLQMMVIVARVKLNGSLMPWYTNMAIGWGTPLMILLVTALLLGPNDYTTSWSCWGDVGTTFGWIIVIPVVIICCMSAVIVESAGMMSRKDPKSLQRLTEPRQLLSALISQRGVVFVMSSTVCSHTFGLLATYFQLIPLYMACFVSNILSGIAIFTFHTSMDEKIRSAVMKIRGKIKRFFSASGSA